MTYTEYLENHGADYCTEPYEEAENDDVPDFWERWKETIKYFSSRFCELSHCVNDEQLVLQFEKECKVSELSEGDIFLDKYGFWIRRKDSIVPYHDDIANDILTDVNAFCIPLDHYEKQRIVLVTAYTF